MAGIAVLINRTARRFADDPELATATLAAAGPDAVVIETEDVAEISAAARQIHHVQPTTIALCGGDGTYMSGLTALTNAYGSRPLPRIALVPGGTVSTIARNFGVSGSPVAAMTRLVALHGNGSVPVRRHRSLAANGRVGFIFGTALVANFFDAYYEGGATGYGEAARIVSKIFVQSFFGGPFARRVLEPVRCTVDDGGLDGDAEGDGAACDGADLASDPAHCGACGTGVRLKAPAVAVAARSVDSSLEEGMGPVHQGLVEGEDLLFVLGVLDIDDGVSAGEH